MKKCFKCNATKDISDFYVHLQMADGHLNKCKECKKSDVAKRAAEKPDQIKAYERLRNTLPGRRALKKSYAIEYRSKNRDKYLARIKVGNALRGKKLVKRPCEICGNSKSEAHHHDYSKPLEVKWVCKCHHMQLHKESTL